MLDFAAQYFSLFNIVHNSDSISSLLLKFIKFGHNPIMIRYSLMFKIIIYSAENI